MEFDNHMMQRVWDVELEIMDVIHEICERYNLRYSLSYGTLIGAVRHKGFIPWDDDIDIVMPREDYEKLLSIWSQEAPEEYIIQHKDVADDFEQNFTKIRKNNTTFIQDETEQKKVYHKGIFVDIAPCDRLAPGKISKLKQYFACAVELLYSKEHPSDNGGAVGVLERMLLTLPKKWRPALRRKARKTVGKWRNETQTGWFCSDIIQNCHNHFPPDLFDELVLVPYQGRMYFTFAKPDDFLRIQYGDYMKLPPEEERVWKHHPIRIDFAMNYEDLIKEQ